jgi:hypothetical protein
MFQLALRKIWRSNPPEALGKNFEKIIAAHDSGGFSAVERLLASASVSGKTQANAYTGLARYLMNNDCAGAANAAHRAYILDPKPYRLKWLAFRLHEAKNIIEAKTLLDILPRDTPFSESETRRARQLRMESLQLQRRGAIQGFGDTTETIAASCGDSPALDFPVDIVYLWSSGSPKRLALRQHYLDPDALPNANLSIARTRQNDELKYALRSIEKNLPWLRTIFIVVDDNEHPEWLDIKNPRIRIVSTSEIIDAQYLPVFNSNLIEMNVHKIPDLSDRFLMSCDDFLVLKPLPKSYFFGPGGIPVYRTREAKKNPESPYYNHLLFIAGVATFFTMKNHSSKILMTYHGIQAHSRTSIKHTLERTEVRFLAEVASKNRFRNALSDLDHLLYALIGSSRGEYIVSLVSDNEYTKDSNGKSRKNPNWSGLRHTTNYHTKFVSYIDTDRLHQISADDEDVKETSDSHRIVHRLFMERLFPGKSSVEL